MSPDAKSAKRTIFREPAALKKSFAEFYNVDRNDDSTGHSTPSNGQQGIFSKINSYVQKQRSGFGGSLGGMGNSGGWPEGTGGWGSNPYVMIRSDLDEDRFDFSKMPALPGSGQGVRDRNDARKTAILDGDKDVVEFWVEAPCFQMLSGMVICLNAIVIGLETDIDIELWWWTNQGILLFFFFELAAKMFRHGLVAFICHQDDWAWNVFDMLIVLMGVADQWAIPAARAVLHQMTDSQKRSHMTVFFMLLRMARLLRIVRIFRLIRIVRPLYELAQGVLEALQGMFWVLVFVVMTIYTAAILCTLLIGKGTIFQSNLGAKEIDIESEFEGMFNSVDTSMFALFGTMSSWSLATLEPLFEEVPFFRVFFVVFYVYSAWTLLAIMTGVVSENMIAIREQMLKEDEARDEKRKSSVYLLMMNLFTEADEDNSGCISREEFDWMLQGTNLKKKLEKNTRITSKDLQDLFEWLDHDREGSVTLTAFMDGFKWMNENLRAKSLVRLFERFHSEMERFYSGLTDAIEVKKQEVSTLLMEPLRKVNAIAMQLQGLDVNFADLVTMAQDPMETPTAAEIRAVEERLGSKLAEVNRRLDIVYARAKEMRDAPQMTYYDSTMSAKRF